jgi:hypothetical protein
MLTIEVMGLLLCDVVRVDTGEGVLVDEGDLDVIVLEGEALQVRPERDIPVRDADEVLEEAAVRVEPLDVVVCGDLEVKVFESLLVRVLDRE